MALPARVDQLRSFGLSLPDIVRGAALPRLWRASGRCAGVSRLLSGKRDNSEQQAEPSQLNDETCGHP